MASFIIENVDDLTLRRINGLAASKNRSLQAEMGDLLRQALSAEDRAETLHRIAEEVAALTPKDVQQTDSVELLREDRDR